MTKDWLSKQHFSIMKWVVQFPNVNAIEHLGIMLKRKLNQYSLMPMGLVELWKCVLHTFNDFTLIEYHRCNDA